MFTINKGIILVRLKEIARENNLPVLLVTGYIPVEIAKEYTDEGINYLDIAGNCHIREQKLLIPFGEIAKADNFSTFIAGASLLGRDIKMVLQEYPKIPEEYIGISAPKLTRKTIAV